MKKIPEWISTTASFLLIGLLLALFFISSSRKSELAENVPNFTTEITLGETPLYVALADTPALRELGLSNTEELTSGQGMLFVLDQPEIPGFWMKDMNYPIDIIWITADKSVIGVSHSVSPDTYPNRFSPQVPVLYVLETPAGFAESFAIQEGTMLSF